MSDDSSDPAIPQRRPLSGLPAAISSLLGAGLIYTVVPVIAVMAVAAYPYAHGWSGKRISDWLTGSVTAQFFYFLIAEAITVLVIFGLLKWFRWSWRSIGFVRPRWYHLLAGIAAALPYYALYIGIVVVVGLLVPGFDQNQKQDIGFDSVHGPLALTLTFLSLVILPPIAEEITMRGFLYTGLRKWMPRIIAALVVSVLFGAAHLAEGGAAGPLWVGALDTFALSLVLVGLRELTGNLWAGIVLHMTKNLVAFLALFIFAAG